jgi:hypothetical protein
MSTSGEIKASIRDIKASLKKLDKSPVRGDAREQLRSLYINQLSTLEVELRGQKIRERVEKHGINYDDWWTWAQSLYSITFCINSNQFVVDSKAREWKDDVDMSWAYPDEMSCKEKIEQLCGYKLYDRKRGRGDMDQDLNQGA